jgi:HAD superfamily hydrolase (TIGR01509 family)
VHNALILDCDGVLGDTEADGHLVAFNQMWQKLGVPWQWSPEQYAVKLKIGGGKERMASLFQDADFRERVTVPESDDERRALVALWHKEKTAIYQHIIESGMIPPRPGIRRLANEAHDAGWKLAVASTSAPAAVDAVLGRVVGRLAGEFLVLSGDIVPAKKPAPDIYNLALERLGLPPQNCVAIEDSRNGMLSACAAHLPVLVTLSAFTVDEDFTGAGLVVDSLGEPHGPHSHMLANHTGVAVRDCVRLEHLTALLESVSNVQQLATRPCGRND